jgi:ankyrin repeat protein
LSSLSLSFAPKGTRFIPSTTSEESAPQISVSERTTPPPLPAARSLNSWRGREVSLDGAAICVREVDVGSGSGGIGLELQLPESKPGEPDYDHFHRAIEKHIFHHCPTAIVYQGNSGRMIVNTIGDELPRVASAVQEVKTLLGFMQLIGGDLWYILSWLNDPQLVSDLHEVLGPTGFRTVPCAPGDLDLPRDVVLRLASCFAEADRPDLLLAMLDVALPRCHDSPADLCREWIGLAGEALKEGNGGADATRTVAKELLESKPQGLDGNDRAQLARLAPYEASSPTNSTMSPALTAAHAHLEILFPELFRGPPVQPRASAKQTELMLKCERGDVDGALECLVRGDEVNVKDALGGTALHYACRSGSTELLLLLLANNADVEARDNLNRTPLHWACLEGRGDAVANLIGARAKIDAECLRFAREYGHQAVAGILVRNGASDSSEASKSWDDATAGDLSRDWDTARSTLSPLPEPIIDRLDKRDQQGKTRLMRASQGGDLAVVQNCVELGADIDAKDDLDQTPLILAARAGHKGIVDFLIANRAKVNSRDERDETPLLVASAAGHSDIVDLLLSSNADIGATNNVGMTALMLAAQRGKANVVKMLLAKGADRQAKDLKGRTAAQLAAMQRHHAIAKLLGRRRSKSNRIGQGRQAVVRPAEQTQEKIALCPGPPVSIFRCGKKGSGALPACAKVQGTVCGGQA